MRTGIAVGVSLVALTWPTRSSANVEADIEAGVVFASRSDTRIPGKGGTDLSLVRELSTPPAPAFRLRLGYRIAERHLITALYAPLRLSSRGVLDRDIDFAGSSFPAGSSVFALYRFDSYRLTYRYSFIRDEAFELAGGFTGKIRDAEIALYGPAVGRKTNTGFVPLLNLHVEWKPRGGAWGAMLDADALAAPQGRAEDVLLALTWTAREGLDVYAGYRTLEGGADNDEVMSFAWLHYAAIGMRVRL